MSGRASKHAPKFANPSLANLVRSPPSFFLLKGQGGAIATHFANPSLTTFGAIDPFVARGKERERGDRSKLYAAPVYSNFSLAKFGSIAPSFFIVKESEMLYRKQGICLLLPVAVKLAWGVPEMFFHRIGDGACESILWGKLLSYSQQEYGDSACDLCNFSAM